MEVYEKIPAVRLSEMPEQLERNKNEWCINANPAR
jgi:hypothetical protein